MDQLLNGSTKCNRYHHLGWFHGVELFEASFRNQTFARHSHEGFAIGAIGEGVGGYLCRGESMVLPAGSLSLMNPDEPHTGRAAAGHVRDNMLYASEKAMHSVLGLRDLRGFGEIALQDRGLRLTRALTRLSWCLNNPSEVASRLGAEEAVHEVLTQAFAQYGGAELRQPGREPAAIRTLLVQIEAAIVAGFCDQAHLIRQFRRHYGVTPGALIRH